MKQIVIASILLNISGISIAQGNAIGNLKASAKIESFCQIQAIDVNFGVVNLPLTAQSANSELRVVCSNNTLYNIDLTYGNNTGGTNTTILTVQFNPNSSNYTKWDIIENGVVLNSLLCFGSTAGFAYNNANNEKLRHAYGLDSGYKFGTVYTDAQYPFLCSKGTLSPTHISHLESRTAKDFGSMTGAMKKDSLAYRITLPKDSTKTWSKGLNSHKGTGVGVEQKIAVNAKIVPEKSSSNYVAQDTYLDTVTATISY